MFVAEQKRKDNIVEYVLYMWQVQDMIRALNFDHEAVVAAVIQQEEYTPEQESQLSDWYKKLIQNMQSQGIQQKGHVREVKEVIVELSYLHSTLINIIQDERYKALFSNALPNIRDFKTLSQGESYNEVETCLNAMYAKLLLRLQGKEISEETEVAMNTFRQVLAYLAGAYNKMQRGELNFQQN